MCFLDFFFGPLTGLGLALCTVGVVMIGHVRHELSYRLYVGGLFCVIIGFIWFLIRRPFCYYVFGVDVCGAVT